MAGAKGEKSRERQGFLAGLCGVAVNLCLFAAKLTGGLVSGSISLVADAVNNLSDALGGLVAAAGFKIAAKPADEKHPYGHARSEYIASLVLAVFMLVTAFEIGKSAGVRIVSPEPMELSFAIFVLTLACVIAKIGLYFYYRVKARKLDSKTLSNAAKDSLFDALATFAVFCSLCAQEFFGVLLDGYFGLAVCLFVLVSSVRILIESFDPLLGAPPDKARIKEIEQKILSYPETLGVHDLVLHNYGANNSFVTAHLEMDARSDLTHAHELADKIERDFLKTEGVMLTIHIDPVSIDDPLTEQERAAVSGFVKKIGAALSVHDFRVVRTENKTTYYLDLSVPSAFSVPDRELRKLIEDFFDRRDPGSHTVLTIDRSFLPSL